MFHLSWIHLISYAACNRIVIEVLTVSLKLYKDHSNVQSHILQLFQVLCFIYIHFFLGLRGFLIPNLIACHLPEWSETSVKPKPLSALSCKGATIDNVFSILFTNPSWFTVLSNLHEDFCSCQSLEWKKCCVLRHEARCYKLPAKVFSPLLQGW